MCSHTWGGTGDIPMPSCSLQLMQDRRRAEEYMKQSLPYLKNAQPALRVAAIRFIGEPQPPGSVFWQPGPSACCCTGSEGQPCGCQSPAAPCRALASLSQP